MPAPFHSADEGEVWFWGNSFVVIQNNPGTISEQLAAMQQNKYREASGELIRYPYVATVFYQPGCNPSGENSSRPYLALTVEQCQVGLMSSLGVTLPEELRIDRDGWDEPALCAFTLTGRVNYNVRINNPTKEICKKHFFEILAKQLEGQPTYYGTIQKHLQNFDKNGQRKLNGATPGCLSIIVAALTLLSAFWLIGH